MKRWVTILAWVLLGLLLLLPVGVLVCAGFEYRFVPASYPAFAAFTAGVAVAAAILCGILDEPRAGKLPSLLFAVSLPLSVVNAAFYVQATNSFWVFLLCLLCTCACGVSMILTGRDPARVTSICAAVVLAIPVLILSFFSLMFGSIGENTVLRRVDAPSGTCYAEIIDDDQGALGGGTKVSVYAARELDLGLLRISPKPRTVYYGGWGEGETMTLEWEDGDTLIINGKAYSVP